MHHSRRKSGHGSANTSMTDVRKSVTVSDLAGRHHHDRSSSNSNNNLNNVVGATSRDSHGHHHKSSRPVLSRRATPNALQKLGKNPRDREREWEEERWWEEERESFPQYCMSCEKQFMPEGDRFLYCSEACRKLDQSAPGSSPTLQPQSDRRGSSNYPFYAAGNPEPRDIIPRASPSRAPSTSFSPPGTPHPAGITYAAHQQSAIDALRSLSIRPPSPPSPSLHQYQPNIWPFTRSAAVSPCTSYSKPSTAAALYSSTYDAAGYFSPGAGTTTSRTASSTHFTTSPDRPLPSRRPGGAYARPKSIELVTPMMGR